MRSSRRSSPFSVPWGLLSCRHRSRGAAQAENGAMLTAQDLHDAFMELGARARREGKVIDLAIYGGSALLLASNFRIATQDVDAVVEGDQGMVARWAEEIA